MSIFSETGLYGRFVLAFAGVMFLIFLCAWGGRVLPSRSFPWRRSSSRRLEVLESLTLDDKRRVVMIRRDQKEYTLLLTPQGVEILDDFPKRPCDPSEEFLGIVQMSEASLSGMRPS